MLKSDFHYDLPERLIAQSPPAERSGGRLLCLDGITGCVEDRRFANLPGLLRPGDLLVLNDTRVMAARLFWRKSTGGHVEILIERVLDPHAALAHLRASKSPKAGAEILLDSGYACQVRGRRADLFKLEFAGATVDEVLEAVGHIPLPPYIDRADEAADRDRYQTVFARTPGAIAAPTAGLHFDEATLARLDAMGVERAFVTLHVGSGTFLPVGWTTWTGTRCISSIARCWRKRWRGCGRLASGAGGWWPWGPRWSAPWKPRPSAEHWRRSGARPIFSSGRVFGSAP